MMESIGQLLGALSTASAVRWGLMGAAIVEAVTLQFRFGFKMESTRDTAWLAYLTFGIRIHHGYIGALMLLVVALASLPLPWRQALIIGGVALLISDLVHHFLVLWPIVGSPQFDLTYDGWWD